MKRFALLLLACLSLTKPVHALQSNEGKIAFAEIDTDYPVSQTFNIYTINPDGADVQVIYTTKVGDKTFCPGMGCRLGSAHLSWSPDYQSLLFVGALPTVDNGILSTIVVSSDGKSSKVYNSDYTTFKWSPDGKYLAYLYKKGRTVSNANLALYIANADGSSPQRFSEGTGSELGHRGRSGSG